MRYLLAVVLLFALSMPAAASTVHIQADQQGVIDVKRQLFVGEGNVKLTTDELSIEADRVEWQIDSNLVVFTGNVILTQHSDKFFGTRLNYNLDTAKGEFVDFRTAINLERAEEPVYLYGDRVAIDGEDLYLDQATVTTCDLDDPHYSLKVKEIEIYPNDKMIIRQVTYYEGKIPLFYWPYLVVSLDEDVYQRLFNLPEVGYGATEGFFIKYSHNYFLTSNAYGSLHLDYYTKIGPGLGVTHDYSLGELGEGQLYLYYIPHKEVQELTTRFEHRYAQERLDINLEHQYYEDLFTREVDASGDFRFDSETLLFTGSGSYEEDLLREDAIRSSISGQWIQDLTDHLALTLKGEVTNRYDQRFVNYLAETKFTTDSNNSVALAVEERYNPDLLDEEEVANWSSVNRKPEATLTLNTLPVPGSLKLGAGRFQEFPSRAQADRVLVQHDYTNSYRVDSTTLRLNTTAKQFYYDTSERQASLGATLNTSTRLTQDLTLTSRYNRKETWGETPFRFDQEKPANLLSGTVRLTPGPFTFRVGTGYNFLTEQYQSLVGNAQYRSDKLTINTGATYNLNTKEPGTLTSLVRYRGKDEQEFSIGAQYHLAEKTLKRVDGKFTVNITETIQAGYQGIYDFSRETFTRSELALTFDLHCRKIRARYDYARQEVWLEYVINAFPDVPLRFRRSDEGTLFEYEELQNVLDYFE